MNTIYTKTFSEPPFDKNEILRYTGAKESSNNLETLIEDCIEEVKNKLTYKVCYGQFPLLISQDILDISFMKIKSRNLLTNLSGCNSYILFAATVGIELDRLISRYGKISPLKALIFQAIGAERIECLCDIFCEYINTEYGNTKPRFSPGYGDLPIQLQKDFFMVLEPSRKIGLTLNESMIMTPSKSVTAIIGIADSLTKKENHNCNHCNKNDCIYRRKL